MAWDSKLLSLAKPTRVQQNPCNSFHQLASKQKKISKKYVEVFHKKKKYFVIKIWPGFSRGHHGYQEQEEHTCQLNSAAKDIMYIFFYCV